MTSYTLHMGVGNIFAGENDYLWVPGQKRGSTKYGVVLLHGANSPNQYADPARNGSMRIGPWLAMAGIPVVAGAMGGDTFANDTAMSRIDAAITYMAAQTGVPSNKVILCGGSMGGALAIRYASLYPSKVACVVGFIPLCNINTIYQNNTAGLRAAVGTAWGVTYPTALPSGADLPTLSTAMKNVVPSRLYYSDADALIDTAQVEAMEASAGSELVLYDPGDYGHTELEIKAIFEKGRGYASEIIDYMKLHGA